MLLMKVRGYTTLKRLKTMRKLGLQDFLDRLEKRGDCLEYVGPRHKDGYGNFGKHGSSRAHRISYEYFVAPIPEGKQVLHKCDNPPCVLPAHLFLGTHDDNMRDRTAKGRNTTKDNCGTCGGPWDYYNFKRKGYVCKACTRTRNKRNRKVKKWDET